MTDHKNMFSRRQTLQSLGLAAGYVSLAALARPVAAQKFTFTDAESPFHFPQGVASGDPQPNGVVIWTRAEDKRAVGQPVTVRAQMSQTADFSTVIVDEKITVGPESDNCLRLHVHGLEPNTSYFYRFLAGPSVSRLGQTRTAPAPDQDVDARFAFASCQNFEQAFYGAWARMIVEDEKAKASNRIQFVLFLGDFIYEVRGDRWDGNMQNPKWLKDKNGQPREMPPFPDGSAPWPSTNWNINPGATNAVSLNDYRFLYKLYLSDPHLQAARARWPFICTWDDHEFTNDAWQSHDTYLDQGGKPAQRRKVAANKAWFEYIPVILSDAPAPSGVKNPAQNFRAVTVNDTAYTGAGFGPDEAIDPNPDNIAALGSMTIYRSLRWGKRLEVFLTDNRSYKSPPPQIPRNADGKRPPLPPIDLVRILDAGRTANGGSPPENLPRLGIENPRVKLPPGSVLGLAQKTWFKAALKASDATWKVWANSFPALPLRFDMSNIPFSGLEDSAIGLDAWNGYPSERQELLEFIRTEGIANVMSCAGDHHAHFAGRLVPDTSNPKDKPVALEFACAGISSEPMFLGAERATRSSSIFHAVATFESGGKKYENFNQAFLGGTYAALMRALTGSSWMAYAYWNPSINPGLEFVDSNANGYGLVNLGSNLGEAILVTTSDAETDHGATGAPVLRTTAFRFEPWKPGQEPLLTAPVFTGEPPFPFPL